MVGSSRRIEREVRAGAEVSLGREHLPASILFLPFYRARYAPTPFRVYIERASSKPPESSRVAGVGVREATVSVGVARPRATNLLPELTRSRQ